MIPSPPKTIFTDLARVRAASRKLVTLHDEDIRRILDDLATLTLAQADFILRENRRDLERMDPQDPKYDRLLLNRSRLEAIADDLRKIGRLPTPLQQVLEEKTLPNGLQLRRMSVPLGVVGVVYESRPNVTFDVFAICLKTGNASVLKGSRDAHFSNQAIVSIIRRILTAHNLPDACYLAPSEREALTPILEAVGYIDVVIPRGSQALIEFVRQHARVPVIETGAGICHTYIDQRADLQRAAAIITNAKARRVSVCNSLDCLLVHRDQLMNLPFLLEELGRKHQCRVHADAEALAVLGGHYPADLLHAATEDSFGTEFLSMQLAVKTVDNLDAALDHIAQHGSRHSEAIVSEQQAHIDRFLREVDAAVVYANASTAFTDGGQFGLGAEIGISTQKLHARGPMALRELTSYKWLAVGSGQIRS